METMIAGLTGGIAIPLNHHPQALSVIGDSQSNGTHKDHRGQGSLFEDCSSSFTSSRGRAGRRDGVSGLVLDGFPGTTYDYYGYSKVNPIIGRLTGASQVNLLEAEL